MAQGDTQSSTRPSSRSVAFVAAVLVLTMASASQSAAVSTQRQLGWRSQEAEALCMVASILVTQAAMEMCEGRWERYACGERALRAFGFCEAPESQLTRHVDTEDCVTFQPLREALLNLPPPIYQAG